MELNEIYTAQGYIDEMIVNEKSEARDYIITIEMIDDDGVDVPMLVDGNHSLAAALRDGATPEIIIGDRNHRSLVEYVESMNDLSNPVNIVTGAELW